MQMRESVLTHVYFGVMLYPWFAGYFVAFVANKSNFGQNNRVWIKNAIPAFNFEWHTGIPAVFAS